MIKLISIAVCDDEAYMAEELAKKVYSFFKKEGMDTDVSKYSSGEDLLRCKDKPDIVFLDIQMGGADGFETAKRLRESGFEGYIIFVTVLRDGVFGAFEVRAFDYLVKPLCGDEFVRTMNRLISSVRDKRENRLLIRRGAEWDIIPFADIVYCEVMDRKVYIHLKDSEVVDYYDKMSVLENKLDGRFFRCHRSYILNLHYLKSFKPGSARLFNGECLPVSRYRGEELSAAVMKRMGEGGSLK